MCTKTCYKCKQEKLLEDFYKTNRGSKSGRSHECKSCANVRSSLRRKNRPDKISEANFKYNSSRRKEIAARTKDWQKQNADKHNANCMRRYLCKLQATPKWLTPAHILEIQAFYTQANEQGLQVDHIVPIRGKTVCGLHVPWNLQLLTPFENRSKGNKLLL